MMRIPSRVSHCVSCHGLTERYCDTCWKPLCDRRHNSAHICALFLLAPPPPPKLAVR